MTWIRKYILNRIVSYAVCLLGVFLAFYIIVIDSNNSLRNIFVFFLFFILPPLYYLAYVNYLNKKLGIWLKCFQAILLLGVAGLWILLIFFIIEEGLPDIDDIEILLCLYLLLLPIAFLEALYSNNQFKFTSILKFFLKKIVWVPIASIVSFVVVWSLIVMVSIGGFQNFKERTILEKEIFLEWLEYKVSGDEKVYCKLVPSNFLFDLSLFGEFGEFFFNNEGSMGAWNFFDVPQREALDRRDPEVLQESHKKAKSFLPFFKGDPKAQVQQAYLTYDKENLKGNWCKKSRLLLRAAHQGDEVALGLLTHSGMVHPNLYDSFWLKRDISTMDLNNPVVAFAYAKHLNEDIYFYEPNEHDVIEPSSEVLRYVEQSANAGYITAMQSLEKIYSDDIHFNEENCSKKIKIHEDLASQKSMIDTWSLMHVYMGKGTEYHKPIYRCLGKKPNFTKAFSLITNIISYRKDKDKKTFGYREALFYLNGWSVKQDYQKAFEIFSECKEETICNSYYAFMTLKGLGTIQDEEMGKEFFVTKAIKHNYKGISCGGEKIDFGEEDRLILDNISDEKLANKYKTTREKEVKKEKERKQVFARVVQCIKDADRETLLAIVEAHIRDQLSKFYQNEDLLATLNVMGEPQ